MSGVQYQKLEDHFTSTAERQSSTYYIGQTFAPGELPFVEDVYRVDTKVESKWFVVQTNPKCEGKASERAALAGFEPYFPKRTYWGKRDRRTQKMPRRVAPAMPGYLFIHMPEEGAFDRLRRCDGVFKVVETQGAPAAIPERWITGFQDREGKGEFDSTKRRKAVRNDKSPFPEWVFPGAIIRIDDGPFQSHLGSIVEAQQAGRVTAEIEIFGRPTRVELELAQIKELC